VNQVAAMAEHDVAIEAMWAGQVFVGVRWALTEVDEALAGARRVNAALFESVSCSAESALVSLLDSVPDCPPESAELGAVNAWASTGPLVLWRRGDPLGPTTVVDEALASRPDLIECCHPVALETAATDPRSWWVGVVVTGAAGPAHRLDRRLLDDALVRGVRAAC
jgi:hypothetical protein